MLQAPIGLLFNESKGRQPRDMGLIFDRSGVGSGSCVGRVDNLGNVFTGSFGGSYKGKVDSEGFVHEVGFLASGSVVGRVEANGRVYSGVAGGSYLGRVDSSGFIHDNSGVFDGSIVGKADPPNQREGGAAFLLLLG